MFRKKMLLALCFFGLLALLIGYDVFVIYGYRAFSFLIKRPSFYHNYLISLIVLTLFLNVLCFLFTRSLPYKILSFVLLLVPLALQTIHYSIYNQPIDIFAVRTTLRLPLELSKMGIEMFRVDTVAYFLTFAVVILLVFIQFSKQFRQLSHSKLLMLMPFISFILFLVFILNDRSHASSKSRNQTAIIAAYAILPESIFNYYKSEIQTKSHTIKLAPIKKHMPNIVWIIGESVVKSHMSLYGYKKDTTPNLVAHEKTGELIAFQNAVSIGNQTAVSVPYMLKGLQRNDPDGEILSAPSIFEYAKARGYQTALLSAQNFSWLNIDKFVNVPKGIDYFYDGKMYNPKITNLKGVDDLEFLEKIIFPYVEKVKGSFLTVIQMDGSHLPYSIHSPAKYKKFIPENASKTKNSYDNTLVYSDIYLDKLIKFIRAKDSEAWIFYTTDHGQGFLPEPNELADIDRRTHIAKMRIDNAFFVLPASKYKSRIFSNRNAPVAQSDIFATIMELLEIKDFAQEIDGISLLQKIPSNRIRLSTSFVTTLNSGSESVIISPEQEYTFIDHKYD